MFEFKRDILVGIMLMPQWFDNTVSVRPNWAAECGTGVETPVNRVPCYVQDTCPLFVMSQVYVRYVLIMSAD